MNLDTFTREELVQMLKIGEEEMDKFDWQQGLFYLFIFLSGMLTSWLIACALMN